jgi:alanine racemase
MPAVAVETYPAAAAAGPVIQSAAVTTSRRSFLGAGAAAAVAPSAGLTSAASAAAAVLAADAAPTATAVHSSFDPWVEVSAANLRWNAGEIARLVAPRPILAVIKNNGYGLGVVNAARALELLTPVLGFAVVKLAEAVALRDAGIRKPILLMGPFDETALGEALDRDVMPMVYTPVGDLLDRQARRRGRPVPVHVCVDTGIGRVGVPHREAPALVRDLAGRSSVRIEGVMMTFAEDAAFDREQLARFQSLTAALGEAKVPLGNGTRPRASPSSSTRTPFWRWCGRGWRSSACIRSPNSGVRASSTYAPR